MKRLICWLVGHRWRELRFNLERHLWMLHVHTMMGVDADCERCGEKWREANWKWELAERRMRPEVRP